MVISSRRSLVHAQQCSPEIMFTLYVWIPHGFCVLLAQRLNSRFSPIFIFEFYILIFCIWSSFAVFVHTVWKFVLGKSESIVEKSYSTTYYFLFSLEREITTHRVTTVTNTSNTINRRDRTDPFPREMCVRSIFEWKKTRFSKRNRLNAVNSRYSGRKCPKSAIWSFFSEKLKSFRNLLVKGCFLRIKRF